MASNPLFSALQDNFGGDEVVELDDFSNLAGLIAYCQKWLDEKIEASDLNNPCLALAGRLIAAAKSTEASVANDNAMDDRIADALLEMAAAFQSSGEVLEQMPRVAEEADRPEFEEGMAILKEDLDRISEAQEILNSQVGGSQKICPKCASAGDEPRCKQCKFMRLYPLPLDFRNNMEARSAHLPGAYVVAYRAYQNTLAGTGCFSALLQAIPKLASYLGSLVRLSAQFKTNPNYKKLTAEPGSKAEKMELLLDSLDSRLEQALTALERIDNVRENLQTTEIVYGWNDFFVASVDIEKGFHEYRLGVGMESESVEILEEFGAGGETVEFSGL